MEVPFNSVFVGGRELDYVRDAVENTRLAGNGPYCRRCEEWLQDRTGSVRALMTPSGTAALEIAVLLAGIGAGDEVIMPSFTFTSTANAVVLRGGVPVFVDVRPDTLNIDEGRVAEAIGARTVALLPVHYAGIAAEMDPLLALASDHGLTVIEDAAQGLLATYRDRPLGSLGDFAALSFHETKNIVCGEGGALLVNRPELVERAEVVHEKGTDRSRFFRGEVDKYTWREPGSSFPLSELNAAFLWAQMEIAEEIQRRRHAVWDAYHERLEALERDGLLRRPIVPEHIGHNAHIYYVLLREEEDRDRFISSLGDRGVNAVFHYVPLHSSEAGRKHGRTVGDLDVTESIAARLVRLPLWPAMGEEQVDHVVQAVSAALRG